MNAVRLLLLAITVLGPSCAAQIGSVTFYSPPKTVKEGLKHSVSPAGEISFTGWLYDGDQKLAHASAGRFMTFHLAAGEHTFTVPWKPTGPGKTKLRLDIQEGAHYCVRLSAKYLSPVLVPAMRRDSQIKQIDCQAAAEESRTAKPLGEERVDPAMRSKLDAAGTFRRE